MSIDSIRDRLPRYARDLSLNLGSLFNTPDMTPQQLWGSAVACAIAGRNTALREAVIADASEHLSEEAMTAAKGAAAMMSMTNVYYRAIHLLEDEDYSSMRAGLRMTFIGRPGIEKADFELFCFAVSAVKGCGNCLKSHDRIIREAGISRAAAQHSLKIASVMHAVAVALDAEGVA